MPGLAPMLAAALLARTGATMVGLSMGFVAYEQTASAFTLAVVAASFGVAFAASSLVAGHVLIRVGLRAMLVGALASQFAGALALASVTSTAGADVTWLIIFSVVAGLASAFIFVGSQMLLHGVAPGEHLQRAVSLDAATMSVSRIAGPALGGILLAVIGIPPVFLLAACCYLPLLGVVAVLAARLNDPPPARRPRLREAARFFGQLRILRWALLTAALAELIALPLVQMMPAVTESLNRDAADRLGILVACVAVGSVGQILVIERLRARHDARVIVGVMYVLYGGVATPSEAAGVGAALCVLMALNIYIVSSIAPDVPVTRIMWGTIPYVLCMMLQIVILCVFPEIATWLPDHLMGTMH